jgi:ABC-type sugar transport system substrate-binding protein
MHIALLLPDSHNPYYRASADAATSAAERHGVSIDIEFAEGGSQAQLLQVQAALRATPRPDVVLIMPVQEADFSPVSVLAAKSGVGWFWLNRSDGGHAELRSRFPGVPVCLITPDQVEAGRIQGRQLDGLLMDGGQALYVQGRAANQSAQRRAAGFREIMRRSNARIRIVAVLDGNWSAGDAARTVEEWLRKDVPARPRIDAVACQSDLMAAGALKALRQVGAELSDPALGLVRVLGIDGVPDVGRRMVDAGELAATVILPITTDRAIDLAHAFRSSGTLPPSEVVLEPRAYPDEATLRGLRFASRVTRR